MQLDGRYCVVGKKLVTICPQNNDEANGKVFRVGCGFGDEYGCHDSDSELTYEATISADQLVKQAGFKKSIT